MAEKRNMVGPVNGETQRPVHLVMKARFKGSYSMDDTEPGERYGRLIRVASAGDEHTGKPLGDGRDPLGDLFRYARPGHRRKYEARQYKKVAACSRAFEAL